MNKSILLYSDIKPKGNILPKVIQSICRARSNEELVIISTYDIDVPDAICMKVKRFTRKRGAEDFLARILKGLSRCSGDIVFLVEHDVLYPPGYFDFGSVQSRTIHFNSNSVVLSYKGAWESEIGWMKLCQAVAEKSTLLGALSEKYMQIKDPPSKRLVSTWGIWERALWNMQGRVSKYPTVEVRHKDNFTFTEDHVPPLRKEVSNIPYWGPTSKLIEELGLRDGIS